VKVATLLLAAGASQRFGADKRLASLPSGDTLLATTLATYQRVVGHCTVVIDQADEVLARWLQAEGASVVLADSRHPPRGMGDSLAQGMRLIASQDVDACLIALGDMPWVQDQTLKTLLAKLAQSPIVVPAWQGRRGHPVGFGSRFFAQLCHLSGDRGARAVLQAHSAECCVVPVADSGVVQDVDTPADLCR
jgi:molybdenum cofactor cytidylyltransferase